MKIECLKDKLLNILNKASKISSSKNLNLPILNCILLEGKSNKLIVKSTNLEIGVILDIPAKVEKEGTVAIQGDILNNLISTLSDSKNLKIESSGEQLKIISEKSETSIKTKDHEDFPTIPQMKPESFNISVESFISGLKSVWYSCATSSIKPELSSVLFYNDGGQMIFAATDSFRLAESRPKVKVKKDFGQVLVPFKNALEIVRILEDKDGEISVGLEKNQISLSTENIYITSRIIDSTFPDYQQIIPKDFETEAVVLKQDLVNSLKVASVLSDKFNQVTFKVLPSKKIFRIETVNPDLGVNLSKIDGALSGKDVETSFNLKYITDSLASINSDSLTLSFNDTSKPMVVRGVSDKSFLYLVMPMNK